MGRIKTKDVKRTARRLLELHPDKFTEDYKNNKEVLKQLNITESRSMLNKMAGYIIRLLKTKKF